MVKHNGLLPLEKIHNDEFEYPTALEKLYFAVGLVFSLVMGIFYPTMLVSFGEFTTLLVNRHTLNATISPPLTLGIFGGGKSRPGLSHEQQMDGLVDDCIALFLAETIFCVILFSFCIISIHFLNTAAILKVGRMRRYLLRAILKQDMAWHDTQTSGFTSTITDNLDQIQEGTGEKLGIFIFLITTFVSRVAVAMFYGWELTLVMTVICPIFIILTVAVIKIQTNLTVKETKSCGESSSVVEEAISSIRTVVAYGGESKEVERYEKKLAPASKIGVKSGIFVGFGGGITWMLIYWSYSLCFWYGTPLIVGDRDKIDKVYTPGVVIIILYGIIGGAINLGFSGPYFEAFAKAKASSKVVNSIFQRKTAIDVNAGGATLQTKLNEVEFTNVHFSYPSRPDVKILKGVDFRVKKGETVALVGGSGSGKSTTIQLTERFYDPSTGSVSLNGVDLRYLDLKWVRSQIGLVGQEPVLFNATIAENICCDLDVSIEEMESAAKTANAHDFIMKLPKGYDTNVGHRGSQLSGGQKQRIAIARALVRNPGILLLDEATSALDVTNEAIVQQALDKASKGRTTLIISHRLSSIRNVDRIIVMSGGQIIEEGTHSELMALKKHYYGLVSADAELHQAFTNGPEIEKIDREIADMIHSKFKLVTDETDERRKIKTSNEDEASFFRIMALNKPELLYVIIGSLSSFMVGCINPINAIFYSEMFGVWSLPDVNEVYSITNMYAVGYIIVGLIAAISIFLQGSTLTYAGVQLVSRLRVNVFNAMLHQEMAWFDEPAHSVGALSAKLSGDTSAVQAATGSRLGALLQGISTLGVGVIMSAFVSIKMTLACLLCVPLVLGSLIIEGKVMKKESVVEKAAMESATEVAVEAIMSIRTVASLGQEDAVMKRYNKALAEVERSILYKLRYRGVVFAIGQTCTMFSYTLSYCYGGYLTAREDISYKNIIMITDALLFGAWMLGNALSFVPNISLGRVAAQRLFEILDRKPLICSPHDCQSSFTSSKSDGNICYNNIHFAYPSRPEMKILNGLQLTISKGQTVALVGHSGCGKSTCIQLLQRFYDPDTGSLVVDGKKTTSTTLDRLRSELGIVSQEPVLFDRTIAENIAYGDNSRKVPIIDIIDAAKRANIHNFISSLPAGYETRLGSQGTQLSGGQKQRIAIARALLRNPRILILDEATSALDTQSEKVVQEALDDAMKGRTCIIIAHRLSTITHADVICVLNQGAIVEMGSHEELLVKGGHYTQLVVDGKKTTSTTLDRLRSELGIVSQEPVLFDRTIAENIAYGDNSRKVPIIDIIDAAKRANIHNFISSLPAGYETRLGSQGTQLSGGQKQRIAIARALLRNPRILILDEATSALDTQSEKVVQEALDDAMKGRTCIIIAHRLSTITHADVICVLNQGAIVEMGSHEELLVKGGHYTQLVQQHSL